MPKKWKEGKVLKSKTHTLRQTDIAQTDGRMTGGNKKRGDDLKEQATSVEWNFHTEVHAQHLARHAEEFQQNDQQVQEVLPDRSQGEGHDLRPGDSMPLALVSPAALTDHHDILITQRGQAASPEGPEEVFPDHTIPGTSRYLPRSRKKDISSQKETV
ncbi:uncharacterized protein LOC144767403 [Lissotriton helveticus]